ncbi:TPA: helix-turn-helix domain-containing protein [Citrobacter freundii]
MLHLMQEVSGSLHSFYFRMTTKPIETIEHLLEKLTPFGVAFSLNANERMSLSQDNGKSFIVLMSSGCFSITHSASNLYISTVFAPSITGLVDSYGSHYDVKHSPRHDIRAETRCEGWLVPLDIFVQKCYELNLWHDVAKILAHRIMCLSARDSEMVGSDAYSKIRALLLEVGLYPEEIRHQITISSFIQRRTNISRSRVMGVLSALKKGEYLEIKSGKLISINKKLPVEF